MEENNRKIDELLEQNMSYGKIADLLGIDLIDVINYDNQKIRTKRELQNIPANRKKAIKKMFLEDEMSVSEIADNLGISEKQVNEDLTMMGIDPKLPLVLRKQLLENAKKRKNHSSENKNTSKTEVGGIISTRLKIASELGISRATVENDIVFLRKQGLIEDKGTKQEQKEKRQQELKGLCGKLSIKELAIRYEVAESTIRDDIKYLIETGQIEDETSEEVKRRRLAIPELRKKFYVSEIAEMFGVSTWTTNNDIRWLKKEGLIDATEEIRGRRTRRKVEEIEIRRKKVASLYGKKDRKEIASILGVGESTIRKRY